MNKLHVVFTNELRGKKGLLYSPQNGTKRDYMLLLSDRARFTTTRTSIEKARKEIFVRDNVIIKDIDIVFIHADKSFCKI